MEFTFPYQTLTLNEEQATAVKRPFHVHQRIVASAGSGKTTTLAARISWLILNCDIRPETIVLMTFSRNAAKQMVGRIEELIGKTNLWAGTFHSLAKHLLHLHEKTIENKLFFVDELIGLGIKWFDSPQGKTWISKITHVVVDEFQDINQGQWDMISRMISKGARLIVVGDDAQNIYTWRGSNVRFMLELGDQLKGLADDQLRTNYRSSESIIQVANSVMRFIPTLPWKQAMRGAGVLKGQRPEVRFFWRMKDETHWMIQTIQDIWKMSQKKYTIAILSRTNMDLYRTEEELLTNGIPYRMDENHLPCHQSPKGDEVVDLVTLHASKGLEWDVVFLMHCNDEIFPSSKKKEDIVCERRLFYVALTRARKHLFLSYNKKERDLCRFVREIPSKYLLYHGLARYCLSDLELLGGKPSFESLISRLDGDDFYNLREDGYLKWLDSSNLERNSLFRPGETWMLPKWIGRTDVGRDFLRFLRCWILRLLSQKGGEDTIFRDAPAERALFTLRIYAEDLPFWETWKDEITEMAYFWFSSEEQKKMLLPVEYSKVQSWILKKGIEWSASDCLTATSLLSKIRAQLRPLRNVEYNLHEFTLGFARFVVPTEWRATVLRSWRTVLDRKKPINSVMEDIWRVASLRSVAEGRNAPLYRVKESIQHLGDLELGEYLENLEESMDAWISESDEIQIGLEIETDSILPEQVDFFFEKTFWKIGEDPKQAEQDIPDTFRLLLLALVAGVAQENGIRVEYVGFLFPLTGKYMRIRLPYNWKTDTQTILKRCLAK
jgi:hypothetical protein